MLVSEKDGTVIPLYLYRSILCARTFNVNVTKLRLSEGTKAILRGDAGTKGFLKDSATEGVRPINQMMSEDAFELGSNMPEARENYTEVEDYIKNQKMNIQSHEVVQSNAERAREGRAKNDVANAEICASSMRVRSDIKGTR